MAGTKGDADTAKKPEKQAGHNLFAVVRLRGKSKTGSQVLDTLGRLKLNKANSCILVPGDNTHLGMLRHAEDFVAWGEIDEDTLASMIAKRGRHLDGKAIDARNAKTMAHKILKEGGVKAAGIRPVFRLSPPSRGLRSVRRQFPQGDMGARGETINGLLARMI